jgi:hypothetical protein
LFVDFLRFWPEAAAALRFPGLRLPWCQFEKKIVKIVFVHAKFNMLGLISE